MKRVNESSAATSKPRVRLGVLGAGSFVSRRHMPDALEHGDVKITAICRRDEEARDRFIDHFQLSRSVGYSDFGAMLESAALDAVLIATPNNLHFEQAAAAIERGIHVLLEKPMTIRSDDAARLVELAEQRGVKLGVALNPPFWAHCHRARRALQSESIGPLESAAMYWTGSAAFLFGRGARPENMPGVVQPTDYRADPEANGGGYFIDGGSHLVSELLWLTGLKPVRVSAMMDSTPSDIRSVVTFVLEGGAVASITSIGDSRHEIRRVRNVFGAANGTVSIVHPEFETHIQIKGEEPVRFKEADLMRVPGPIANFVDAILGRAELASPGRHGADVVRVVEAAYESATAGRVVALDWP